MIDRDSVILSGKEMLHHYCLDAPKTKRGNLSYIMVYGRYAIQQIIAEMYTNPQDPDKILRDYILRMDIYAEQYSETHKRREFNPFEVFHDTAMALYYNLTFELLGDTYGYDKYIM